MRKTIAATIKATRATAQYCIVRRALTESRENILFCPMYPSNVNALYNVTKNRMDDMYTYAKNGSLKYISKSVAYAFLPSTCGSQSIKAPVPIPMRITTACKNKVDMRLMGASFIGKE